MVEAMTPLPPVRRIVAFIIVVVAVAAVVLGITIHTVAQGLQRVILPVPYVSQVPDGVWVSPWDEACEEASLLMVQGFYAGATTIGREGAKAEMRKMFAWEQERWKDVEDADAERILVLGDAFSVGSRVVRDPSAGEIVAELRAGHPVIAVVDMYALWGERPAGDGYHVVVVTGHDADKGEFQVMDPAKDDIRWYAASRLMASLHDYDFKTKEATGPATVLFTFDKGDPASIWRRIRRFFLA